MDHSIVYVALVVVGMVANVVWMLVNLRVQNRVLHIEGVIVARIDSLKEYISEHYMSIPSWTGWQKLYEERHGEFCRRVESLENRR